LKDENQWLDAVVKMVPQSISACLSIKGNNQTDSNEYVWPHGELLDPELKEFSEFAFKQGSVTSTVNPEGIACVCVPIKKVNQSDTLGFLCVKARSSDPSAKSLISLLEWSAIWVYWLIEKSKDASPQKLSEQPVDKAVEQTWPKKRLAKWAVALAALCLLFIPVEYRISLDANIRGAIEAPVVAPFDSFIEKALVKPGDKVRLHQPLATLDSRQLQLQLEKLQGEVQEKEKLYRRALAEGERGEVEVLKAKLIKARAQISLARHQLENTVLVAGMPGLVVEGDHRYSIGTSVDKGERLFLITPESGRKVVLEIPETDYRFIQSGQSAELKLTSIPDRSFLIHLASPSPTYVERGNRLVYLVEAEIEDAEKLSLQPGMQGIAKVSVGEASLGWSIFHHFIDWLRLTAWTYKP